MECNISSYCLTGIDERSLTLTNRALCSVVEPASKLEIKEVKSVSNVTAIDS